QCGLQPVHRAHASLRPPQSGEVSTLRAPARAARPPHRGASIGRPSGWAPELKWIVRPVSKRTFGVSTHLYHSQRLNRDHLIEIAAHGFEAVEVFATRTHFDYHSPAAIGDLQQWLAEAGLELHGIHAPI